MPIASPETYRAMLHRARAERYALPSINVTSSTTLHAVLAGLAEAESDGIVGIGLGGARFSSGHTIGELARGAHALAEYAHVVADSYPVNVALHTDHCPPERLDEFVRPLIAHSRVRVGRGQIPLFQSHMFDGSHQPLDDNLRRSRLLLDELAELGIVLEVEIGLVGGEEDEMDNTGVDEAKLYTSPSDMVATYSQLGDGTTGTYMVAASFGNVHGIHPPGDVTLDPAVLDRGQRGIAERFGSDDRMMLVFHGGSGSALDDIRTSIKHGVIKMNVDTDTQYAYTRAVAGHMFSTFDRVMSVDRSVPDKKLFAQSAWMTLGEQAMAQRVVAVCNDLMSEGSTLS